MSQEYDGLVVNRIAIDSPDILTSGTSNCITVVLNVKVNEVCVSEKEGYTYCSEYETERQEVDYTPGDPW